MLPEVLFFRGLTVVRQSLKGLKCIWAIIILAIGLSAIGHFAIKLLAIEHLAIGILAIALMAIEPLAIGHLEMSILAINVNGHSDAVMFHYV